MQACIKKKWKETEMTTYTEQEQMDAWKCICATLENCQHMEKTGKPGTSQHTLLINRIQALTIAKTLMEEASTKYTAEELIQALAPICSILHKCEKALSHVLEGSTAYHRLRRLYQAMEIAKVLLDQNLQENADRNEK